ncbi:nucleotidyltransferase AbiEii toxin of type IV toxin-antitoxin system [Algoriphagus aquaeductus]|uniref:Nucleotidyltransferase AbiEii toxin of type IV toxin-antitoxin system n=1 Tax=Algoriphagus aquaeductus TaxID=475299 RepID=A0A326RPD5_9BACT|nr:nucleotidyl transferase AbiEii/AbiGii toxin family protein [Algoriphagus aquaeductus]PZV80977.1 nucleotidyltransferase AbiEii toxin of type IV toxin-antitoxin system [Algoriphagus aquaeductus]
MLQTQTVEPGTLSLLKKLCQLPCLQGFALVGGTALSLKHGHRLSVDLDLFSTSKFEYEEVIQCLQNEFGNDFLVEDKPARFGIFCYIENVKVDLVRHPHPLLGQVETLEDIRFFSDRDIMAMKIQAILGRGKKKDFWDIAELLKQYSVADFIQNHKEKYSTQNLLISIPQVMVYFEDAEEDEDPVSLKGQTWSSVKKAITKKVAAHLR